MGQFLGFTAVQWQNATRVALGVGVLSSLGMVVTHIFMMHPIW